MYKKEARFSRRLTIGGQMIYKRKPPSKLSLKSPARQRQQKRAIGRGPNHSRPSFKDLGLAGLSYASDPRFPLVKRLFWGILWLILLVSCVTQCTLSLQLYISSPTNVNIRNQRRNIVTPPCVTICNSDDKARTPTVWPPSLLKRFGNISYESTAELVAMTKINLTTLWNMSTIVFDNLTYKIYSWSSTVRDSDSVKLTYLSTLTGVCLTFKSLVEMPCTGKQPFIHIQAIGELPGTEFNEFLVVFHSEAEIPLLRYTGPTAKGVFMTFNKQTTAVLRLEEETRLYSWNKPCLSEENYFQCEADCFERLIRGGTSLKTICRLPFMKEEESIQPCSTAEELREMLLASASAADKMLDDSIYCDCPQPCKKIVYIEEYFIMNNVEDLFDMWVPFPKCQFQRISEEYSYGTTNFIADIGGALGLYLGMSILSIVAFLETLVSNIWTVVTTARMPLTRRNANYWN